MNITLSQSGSPSGKKKNKDDGKRKVFKKKKNAKTTKTPEVGLNLSNSKSLNMTSPTIKCNTCPANYTSFIIDSNAKCFKYGTQDSLLSAVTTCAKDGARPPLPTNTKENADLLAYFLSKKDRKHNEFALDLNDAKTEGLFISSIGQKVNFTNWYMDKPGNKTDDQDFVTMWSDGQWNVYDGNFTFGVIICQIDCPEGK